MIEAVLLALFATWAVGCLVFAALRKGRALVVMPMAFFSLAVLAAFAADAPASGAEARLDMVGQAVLVFFFFATYLVCIPIWFMSRHLSAQRKSQGL